MKYLRLSALALATAAFAAADYAGLDALGAFGPPEDGPLKPLCDLRLFQAESDRIDGLLRDVADRRQLRMALAEDLAAGRLTLPEAALRLRDVVPPGEVFWDRLPILYEGDTEDEWLWRHMVLWTQKFGTDPRDPGGGAEGRAVPGGGAGATAGGEPRRCGALTWTPGVNAGTPDGHLWFSDGAREVTVGPLSPELAENLSEDLAYDGLASGVDFP